MSGRIAFSLFGVLAIAGLALLWSFGCDDKPTEHLATEPTEPRDYAAYFCNNLHNEGNSYFAYHPLTNELDSFYLPFENRPVVSADGRSMYIRDNTRNVTAIVDLDSREIIGHLPYGYPIAASPDGEWLAVYDNGLHLLHSCAYREVFYDSSLAGGVFSRNSLRFYGAPKAGGVYRLDLSRPPFSVTRRSLPFGMVTDLAPSPDESRLYLYLQSRSWDHYFVVLDWDRDSLIFTHYFWPGFGSLEAALDGHYVFYTNAGTMMGSTPGAPWVMVYDARRNVAAPVITTVGILDSPFVQGALLDEMCVTPDGRWLVVLSAKSYPFVLTVDIERMAIAHYVKFPDEIFPFFEGLACQSGW